ATEFSSKFPNELIDKTELQRLLGSLNYVADFIPNMRHPFKPEDELKKSLKEGDKKLKNRYSILAEFPSLPKPNSISLNEPIPSKPNLKDKPSSTCIFVQTKYSYEMKPPETYSQEVVPTALTKNKEKVLPIMALDKEYEGFGVPYILKPCYTNQNYLETKDPLIT
ncbi:hypothetical protein H5410_056823, partial [Solanum commersonii]